MMGISRSTPYSYLAHCNCFGGTYSQESGFVITLGPATMAYCGEEPLDQQYLDLLSQVVAGGPDGAGGLALENAGDQTRMEFSNGGGTGSYPFVLYCRPIRPTPE